MLRTGRLLLSIWAGLNLVLAIGIFAAIAVIGANAPALSILFHSSEIVSIEARALLTINALALLFNACAASLCFLVLVIVWSRAFLKSVLLYVGVSGALLLVQLGGFVSDALLGNTNLGANIASSLLLAGGLLTTGIELWNRPRSSISAV